MKKMVLLFVVSFLIAESMPVLIIDGSKFYSHEFFARVPKKQWARADSLQKDKLFEDFIMRELCVLEAEKLGFQYSPDVAIKIRNRSQQLLVNESYEQFVAIPLIPSSHLEIARKNAKKEVFVNHILIGSSGSYLGKPPNRTLDEARALSQQIKNRFAGGENFSVLAKQYSDDPGVEKNSGSVGWVSWGTTVHEFQLAAFALEPGVLSEPVLTDFGHHLILVTDVRPSDYQHLNDEAYESYVVSVSKNSIRNQLRPAALKYDSLKIEALGVYFNMNAIKTIVATSGRSQKESLLNGANRVDSSTLLESLNGLGVLCVYDGKGYGSKWFAKHLRRIPSSKRPVFSSEEGLLSVFRTIILQDIAIKDGFSGGVHLSFTYRQRSQGLVSDLLYDAYLKHLVNSAPGPDSLDVTDYYNENKAVNYMDSKKFIVREIRVAKRGLADSLLLLVNGGTDFSLLAGQNSSTNPGGGGIYGPFTARQNRPLFDAASLLLEGENSPVLSSSGNNFSIIKLVEKPLPSPRPIALVYAQIESLLIKRNQEKSKAEGVEGLLKIYNVNKNISLLD